MTIAEQFNAWVGANRLLELRFRIPQWAWMSLPSTYSVLSGIDLCVMLIAHPQKSYRVRFI